MQTMQKMIGHVSNIKAQVLALTWPFWVANFMEMIERFAFYGVRVVVPIYICQKDEVNGLHFTQAQKGTIFLWWAIVQSFLPVFTGGAADRWGYKNQIRVAIAFKVIGYLMMATQRDYDLFFAGCMMLAAGTAIFKPPVQATFVNTLNKNNSGAGWGIFYMLVNIGAAAGPPFAHYLYGMSWAAVFYGCAAIVSVNLLVLHTYTEVKSTTKKEGGVLDVVKLTLTNIVKPKLFIFILVMSGFWAGFTQLFDVMPSYIVDWVDSSFFASHLPTYMLKTTDWAEATGIADHLPTLMLEIIRSCDHNILDTSRGLQVDQSWIINLNALLIVALVVLVSAIVNNYMRRLSSILLGMIVSAIGLLILPLGYGLVVCLVAIVLFSIGEMLSSPKMNEYLAVIAPEDQKALYMGYANIPLGIGWAYGAWYGGDIYGRLGEKATLALRYMSGLPQWLVDFGIGPEKSFELLQAALGKNATDTTLLLWNKYQPGQVWYPFAYFIFASAIGLVIYNHFAKKWTEANA